MKADILTLAASLGTSVVDTIMLERFYDEAILALTDVELSVRATLIAVTAGTANYAIPPDAVRVLSVLYDDHELTRTTLESLDDQSRSWQADTGTPFSYIEIHEPERQIRLYPTPTASSSGVPFPAPFGDDYPDNYAVMLTTDRIDPAPWLDLPLALTIMTREFDRESNHRDADFSALCARLGQLLRRIGGTP